MRDSLNDKVKVAIERFKAFEQDEPYYVCYSGGKDSDVWEFLHYYSCKSNPLYQSYCKRIGCIGCPMVGAKSQMREFAIYPAYKKLYIRAFDRMLDRYRDIRHYKSNWQTGQDVFDWWTGTDSNQLSFFDDIDTAP